MSWSVVYMIVIFPLLIVILMALDLVEPQTVPSEPRRDRDTKTRRG